MMNITYRADQQILYVVLEGRVDASNSAEAEKQIFAIRAENQGKHTVIDADRLEYISSAGLRMILKLKKEEPQLAIINVSPEVYEIFDMTGFTEMLTVEKAYPRLNVEGCSFIAKGANGAVYRYDDETIVKVYFSKDALPEIKQERENARRAFVLGVNTAIPYGIVRVDEGYGTVAELLSTVSVTNLIQENPNDLTAAAEHYINMLRSIHGIQVEDGEFPDMKETATAWCEFLVPHLSAPHGQKLMQLIRNVPKSNTLLHGDYHTNNILLQNGEPVLIDLDTLCMGHPIFELASMYNALIGYSEVDHDNILHFLGYDYLTAQRFWDLVLSMYLGTEDPAVCKRVTDKARIIGYVRIMRRAIRRPQEEESAARIEHCRKMLEMLLDEVDTLVF